MPVYSISRPVHLPWPRLARLLHRVIDRGFTNGAIALMLNVDYFPKEFVGSVRRASPRLRCGANDVGGYGISSITKSAVW